MHRRQWQTINRVRSPPPPCPPPAAKRALSRRQQSCRYASTRHVLMHLREHLQCPEDGPVHVRAFLAEPVLGPLPAPARPPCRRRRRRRARCGSSIRAWRSGHVWSIRWRCCSCCPPFSCVVIVGRSSTPFRLPSFLVLLGLGRCVWTYAPRVEGQSGSASESRQCRPRFCCCCLCRCCYC